MYTEASSRIWQVNGANLSFIEEIFATVKISEALFCTSFHELISQNNSGFDKILPYIFQN